MCSHFFQEKTGFTAICFNFDFSLLPFTKIFSGRTFWTFINVQKKKVEGKSFQKVGWTEIFAGKFCGNKNQSNVKYIITKYALLYLYENTDNALGYQKFVGLERAEATAQQGEGVSI